MNGYTSREHYRDSTSRISWSPDFAPPFQALVEHIAIGIAQCDLQGQLLYANPQLGTILGRSQALLTTCCLADLLELDGEADSWLFWEQLREGVNDSFRGEFQLRRGDGRLLWAAISWTLVRSAGGEPAYILAAVEDITQRYELEQRLHARVQRLHTLIKQADTILGIINRNGNIRFVSDSVERSLGYAPQHILGTNVADYLHPDDLQNLKAQLMDVLPLSTHTTPLNLVCRVRGQNGWHHFEVLLTNMLYDPDVNGVVVNCIDITEQQQLQERLQHQAYHDPLTGLPNRALLMERLNSVFNNSPARCSVALLFLDLDRFKRVNDTLGHAVGDELLVQVTRRLRACVRPQDLVARLGGDEFTVLLEHIRGEQHALQVAQRIKKALHHPFQLADQTVQIGTSIGIALNMYSGIEPDVLLHQADLAMYRAKALGRGQYVTYNPELDGEDASLIRGNTPEKIAWKKPTALFGMAAGSVVYYIVRRKLKL